MLTLSNVLLFAIGFSAVLCYPDEHCCCGCVHPCPLSIPARCGAAPTTSCADKGSFNSSELLSPCDLIIKLHDLTASVVHDTGEERSSQPVPIGKDKKRPNSVTVTDSAAKEKNLPSIFAKLFSLPKFMLSGIPRSEIVKNETRKENGTIIRETVRKFPGGLQTTKMVLQNETDPVEAKKRWRETLGKVKQGLGRMDDGILGLQHGMVDSFDSLFKGLLDGVFNILRAR